MLKSFCTRKFDWKFFDYKYTLLRVEEKKKKTPPPSGWTYINCSYIIRKLRVNNSKIVRWFMYIYFFKGFRIFIFIQSIVCVFNYVLEWINGALVRLCSLLYKLKFYSLPAIKIINGCNEVVALWTASIERKASF